MKKWKYQNQENSIDEFKTKNNCSCKDWFENDVSVTCFLEKLLNRDWETNKERE